MRCLPAPALAATAGLLGASSVANVGALQAGEEICVEGYVMDFFCIERGTLFDNPSVISLLEPERHSVHCLVDVAPCLASPYEVLYALPEEQTTGTVRHSRGFRLDDPSKDKLIALARGVGRIAAPTRCTTCTEEHEEHGGSLDNGFHAGMVATVVTPGDATNPPVISVTRAEPSVPGTPFCGADGAGNTDLEPVIPPFIITTGGNFETLARIHGALMMTGWGIMLPSGVLIAKLFRHRPGGWWFKIHRTLQPLGLVVVTAGFLIAVTQFTVFKSGPGTISYVHASLGTTVMALGLFQPLNAFFRPHVNEIGKPPNVWRTVWEFVHKGSGYGACLMAVATIGIGTTVLPNVDDQQKYQMAYGIGAGFTFTTLVAFAIREKRALKVVEDNGPMSPLISEP